jgi:hypothetical protein
MLSSSLLGSCCALGAQDRECVMAGPSGGGGQSSEGRIPGGRDARLDFVRGLALIFIFIDHAPGNALAAFTLKAFGLCDAAEVFVVVSGITAAMVYGITFRKSFRDGLQRTMQRIGKLYLSQLVISLACISALLLAASWTLDPRYHAYPTLRFLPDSAGEAVAGLLSLYVQPGYLNILPLYMVMLAWLPVALALAQRHILLPLVPSLVMWGLAWSGLNLPTYGRPDGWYFNPFAWQLLFTIGLVAGLARSNGLSAPRSWPLFGAAAAYLLFALIMAAPWTVVPALAELRLTDPSWLKEASKQNLSPLRLLNILALGYVVVVLLKRGRLSLDRGPLGMVSTIGRHSLLIFCVATVIDEWLLIVRYAGFRGIWYQAGVNFGGVLLLWAIAALNERWSRRRSSRSEPATRPVFTGSPAGGAR